MDELALFAAARPVKLALIMLDRGRTRFLQPMLTVPGEGPSRPRSKPPGRRPATWPARVPGGGAEVEATPWNEDVPVDAASAVRLGDAMHFEHHVKVALDAPPGDRPPSALLARHGARLSRNARRRRADGRAERSATQRRYCVGLLTAGLQPDPHRPALAKCLMAACFRRSGSSW